MAKCVHRARLEEMLARQPELDTQFPQVIGAFLLALALFAAHALRYCGTGWLDRPYPIDPFRNCQRLLVMIIPFGQPNAREIVRPHYADDDLPRYLGERGVIFAPAAD